jgi:hypothetical protein
MNPYLISALLGIILGLKRDWRATLAAYVLLGINRRIGNNPIIAVKGSSS